MLNNVCEKFAQDINDTLTHVWKEAVSGYEQVGRKLENLTSSLDSPLKELTRQSYWGLPYTALLSFTLPPFGTIAALTTHVASDTIKSSLGPKTSERLYHGVRNFCVLNAVTSAMIGVIFPPMFLSTIANVYLAVKANEHAKESTLIHSRA